MAATIAIEDASGEELGRRVAPLELRHLVQVLEVERAEHRVHRVQRPADVDDDAVRVELAADGTRRRRRRSRRADAEPDRIRHR